MAIMDNRDTGEMYEDIEYLEAENKRLREALEQVKNITTYPLNEASAVREKLVYNVAHQALLHVPQQTESENDG